LDFEEARQAHHWFLVQQADQSSRTTVFDEISGSQFGIRGNVHVNWEREDCKKLTKKRKKNEKRST
jgi:hypothetical protein